MFLGFTPPQGDEFLQFLRIEGRNVSRFGAIVFYVVQLPRVLVERQVGIGSVIRKVGHRMKHHGLPTVVVQRA